VNFERDQAIDAVPLGESRHGACTRLSGEGRYPWPRWVPAFCAGMEIRGNYAALVLTSGHP
jgi:hypothetical protein